jgi:signal transduction histidine kinase
MARTILEGTRAASVEVWVRVGDRLQLAAAAPEPHERASAGDASEIEARSIGAVVAPVHLEDEELGTLVVHMPRGEQLNTTELRLLRDLASQAGLVFSRFRLVEELRESRTRLVVAQDDERRRIERDLHDGAQQRFVNAMLALGMAQAGMAQSPDGADPETSDLLAQAKREMQAGLVDLRSLARGLRPPLLAEEGLPAAIASLADRCPIMTSVSVDTTRRYPPAIEATAYFVVAEALTNAAKHSRASHITVCVADHDGRLQVEVRDDGTGTVDPSRGSGITGLRDRAAAVGGTLSVRSDRGTVVEADLPCA